MNRKGFTFIEALMVIVIIGILSLILVPNVMVLINNNKEKSCNNLKASIESATEIYVTNNKYALGFVCDTPIKIEAQTLIDSGDLSSNVINPITNKDITSSVSVNVTYLCDTKSFTYEVYGIECALK